ncbi:hypothetical protein WA1_47120 [Scytonema hofmannii PCC 7110]|uniref:Uncharacterized protein n=1 Tax=Scytonema hofmannii PCC 7110 TaxID=128403 RepID=A0A139WXS3_9CYAN|nr:hypothetical protein [Scytonema hofmannii]KYC37203.1 hypothetical protein WA1_47120 [Scytonema hofmannii PCC 7110]
MKTCKTFALFAVCAISTFSVPALSLHQVAAEQVDTHTYQANSRKFAGTYLITVSTSSGEFASRSIITFTQDGNFFVVDSNQGGVPGQFNPFSDSQGSWKYTDKQEITATTLNFSYPGSSGSASIARQNYRVTFNPQTKALQGDITLRFYDLKANPLETDAPVVGTFTFTGQRVNAK